MGEERSKVAGSCRLKPPSYKGQAPGGQVFHRGCVKEQLCVPFSKAFCKSLFQRALLPQTSDAVTRSKKGHFYSGFMTQALGEIPCHWKNPSPTGTKKLRLLPYNFSFLHSKELKHGQSGELRHFILTIQTKNSKILVFFPEIKGKA